MQEPQISTPEELRAKAKKYLEDNGIFPPEKKQNFHSMILISGLPTAENEKFYVKIFEPLYKNLNLKDDEKFTTKQIAIQKNGQRAVVRCYNEKMAQEIIRTFNGNNDIYGKKYTLKIEDFHNTQILTEKYSKEPQRQQTCKTIDYLERYNSKQFIVQNLPSYQILIQCKIINETLQQKENKQKQYYLLQVNQLGDCQEISNFLEHESLRWSPKGNFIITEQIQQKIYQQENGSQTTNNQINITIKQLKNNGSREEISKIFLNQVEDGTEQGQFCKNYQLKYQMSKGEKFIIIYQYRNYQNVDQIRIFVFSIYENKVVFKTDWNNKQNNILLQNHLQFIYDDVYFYLIENKQLNIYKISTENSIVEISQINTFSIGLLQDISVHEQQPLIAYYSVPPTSDKPSSFTVLNVKNNRNNMKIISKSMFISQVKIQWNQQKIVSLVVNSNEATSIASFNLEQSPIKQQNFKFHKNLQINDFSVNKDATLAVISCVNKKQDKKKDQQQQVQEEKVLIQTANSEQQAKQVLCEQIKHVKFSNQQNIIQLLNEERQDVHITICDQNGLNIRNYDFMDGMVNQKVERNQDNSLTAIIDKQADVFYLNILDSKGQIILVKQIKTMSGDILVQWRPKDLTINQQKQQIQISEEEYYQQLEQQIEDNKKLKEQQLQKEIDEFNQLFYNEESNNYYELMKQKEKELLGENYVDENEFVEIEIDQIYKNTPIERKITEDEFMTIKQEAYQRQLVN